MKSKIMLSLLLGTTILSTSANATSSTRVGHVKKYTSPAQLDADVASGIISAEQASVIAINIATNGRLNLDPSLVKYNANDDSIIISGKKYKSLEEVLANEGALLSLTKPHQVTTQSQNKESQALVQKFELKKAELFANNSKLSNAYNKLTKMEPSERKDARALPEFQELLGSQELISLNNSAEMQEILKEEVKKANEKAAAGKPDSKERFVKFINEDKDLFLTDTSKGIARLSDLTPVQKPDTLTTDSMLASVGNVTDVLDTRIAEVTTEPLGVASGDGATQYGVWVKGMYSHANQSEYKLVPGYKLDQGGGTIGADIGEDAVFGIAYSYLDSTAKTKNIGIKEKIKSHIGTIYGLFNADNNIFLDGQARYGRSDIKKSRANGNLSNDVSHGKTKGELYGGKVELGYDYTLENKVHLIPSLGVSHDELKVKGYQETGSGLNRKVSKRTASKTSGIVGLRVKQAIETGSFTVIPEVHANLIYAMDTKNGKTTITFLEGMDPITTPSGKMAKASYKIGGSLRFTQFKTVDFGIGYDLGISKKFYSHTGSLNARVNF